MTSLIRAALVISLLAVLQGCAGRTSIPDTPYPTVVEEYPLAPLLLKRPGQYFSINSIDDHSIARDGSFRPQLEQRAAGSDYAIRIEPGVHELIATACAMFTNPLKAILLLNQYRCVRVRINLEVEKSRHYVLRGKIDKRKNFADIWIEDIASRTVVTERVRGHSFV